MLDNSLTRQNQQLLRGLRWRWLTVGAVYGLVVLLGYAYLRSIWEPLLAQRWAVMAGIVMASELTVLWFALPKNHPPKARASRRPWAAPTA
ncbi:MAG: hypothetical protein HC802_15840 [Caldilineaceae bacterium]|nr:hypothetical protein [Caldilineaceae bacterium]